MPSPAKAERVTVDGAAVKRLRERKKMSREELAFKSGVSFSALVAIEQGTSTGSLNSAAALAGVLGVSVEDLLG